MVENKFRDTCFQTNVVFQSSFPVFSRSWMNQKGYHSILYGIVGQKIISSDMMDMVAEKRWNAIFYFSVLKIGRRDVI